MERCVVMAVGDYCSGRTCFSFTFLRGKYPFDDCDYIPQLCDNCEVREIQMDKDRTVKVSPLEDDGVGEDYWRLRPLLYPWADVFIAFYSVDSRDSFESLEERWIPELRDHCPKIPIIIVGNKIDLRKDGDSEIVSYKEGLNMAKKMGTSYFEVSCIQNRGVDECFKLAVEIAELNMKKRSRKFRGSTTIIPPIKPLPAPRPVIALATSTFGDDWHKMVSDPKFHDVKFLLDCGRSFLAHKLVLCSASPFFRKMFCTKSFSKEDIDTHKVRGLQRVYKSNDGEEIIVELSSDIKAEIFHKLLEFMYTKSSCDDAKDIDISELKRTAEIFEMNQLEEDCGKWKTNVDKKKDKSFLIVLKTTDMKEYMKQDVFSDVVFNVESNLIPAHKVVMYARCPKLADLIDSTPDNKEGLKEVQISDVSLKNFTVLLEYIYTDSAAVDGTSDLYGLIVLAYKYGAHRLVTICERAIYEIELVLMNLFDENNAIELLQKYKEYKATQLFEWCRHFISHNYLLFSVNEKFSTLDVEDKNYVEDHCWPPVEYELKSLAFRENLADHDNGTKRKCSIL